MRERGRYQIQLMKTRSSSGVGMKIDLEFDMDSLRIRDPADDREYSKSLTNVRAQFTNPIKQGTTVTDNTDNSVEAGKSLFLRSQQKVTA